MNNDNQNSQVKTFLLLWQMRFGIVDETTLGYYRSIFCKCFIANSLGLDVMANGNDPITEMVAFLDHKHCAFIFYLMGFNGAYSQFPPWRLMVAHSIKYAIEQRYSVYDFLLGDESDKYSFGACD